MKRLIVITVVAVIAVAGYRGYTKYRRARFVESLVPHVKNASLRITNSARDATEDDSKITFKELFEKLESNINEIDKRLLDVQTLSSSTTKKVTEPTVHYLNTSQVFCRSLLAMYRKRLAASIADDLVKKRLADQISAIGSSAFDYITRSANEAIEDSEKADKEYQASIPELLVAISKLKEARSSMREIFTVDALIPTEQLDAIAKKISPNKENKTAKVFSGAIIIGTSTNKQEDKASENRHTTLSDLNAKIEQDKIATPTRTREEVIASIEKLITYPGFTQKEVDELAAKISEKCRQIEFKPKDRISEVIEKLIISYKLEMIQAGDTSEEKQAVMKKINDLFKSETGVDLFDTNPVNY